MKYFKFLSGQKEYPPVNRGVFEDRLIKLLKHRKRLNATYENSFMRFGVLECGCFEIRIISYREEIRFGHPKIIIEYSIIPDDTKYWTVNYRTEINPTDLNFLMCERL